MSNLKGGVWDELSQIQREMHLEHDAQLIIKCDEFVANHVADDDPANDPGGSAIHLHRVELAQGRELPEGSSFFLSERAFCPCGRYGLLRIAKAGTSHCLALGRQRAARAAEAVANPVALLWSATHIGCLNIASCRLDTLHRRVLRPVALSWGIQRAGLRN
ncbi:MAG: hypothetical protein H7255_03640 [Ramlibacter sp.]|nr:hypothetical protein [Ramlibacter sp.]